MIFLCFLLYADDKTPEEIAVEKSVEEWGKKDEERTEESNEETPKKSDACCSGPDCYSNRC